ncbi:MAG: hypothetical protein K6C08_07215 [Oscillospiraceae bacterium]|nr:hypothetical protein [Oscillospiraceae bacterium]
MATTEFTKREAVRIITSAAKDYQDILSGMNYLFIYRERSDNSVRFFETLFLPRNFQHLTGLELLDGDGMIDKKPLLFYERCLNRKLSEDDIAFRSDGTTRFKLEALPRIVNFISSSKMTGLYNDFRPLLAIDRLAGTTNFCLGFTQDGKYYAPSSCLLEDIRNLANKPSQVLAVMSKKSDEPIYKDIRYIAKKLPFDKLKIPDDLDGIIDRSGYR